MGGYWLNKGLALNDIAKYTFKDNFLINSYFKFIKNSYFNSELSRQEYTRYGAELDAQILKMFGGEKYEQAVLLLCAPEENIAALTVFTESMVGQHKDLSNIKKVADALNKLCLTHNCGFEKIEMLMLALIKGPAANDPDAKATLYDFIRHAAGFYYNKEKQFTYLKLIIDSPEILSQNKFCDCYDYLHLLYVYYCLRDDCAQTELTQILQEYFEQEDNENEEFVFNRLLFGVALIEYYMQTVQFAEIKNVTDILTLRLKEMADYLQGYVAKLENGNGIRSNVTRVIAESYDLKQKLAKKTTVQKFTEKEFDQVVASMNQQKLQEIYLNAPVAELRQGVIDEFAGRFEKYIGRENINYRTVMELICSYVIFKLRLARLRKYHTALMNYLEYTKIMLEIFDGNIERTKKLNELFQNGLIPTENSRSEREVLGQLVSTLCAAGQWAALYSLLNQLKKDDAKIVLNMLDKQTELAAKILLYKYAEREKDKTKQVEYEKQILNIAREYTELFFWRDYLNGKTEKNELGTLKRIGDYLRTVNKFPLYAELFLGHNDLSGLKEKTLAYLLHLKEEAELGARIEKFEQKGQIRAIEIIDNLLFEELVAETEKEIKEDHIYRSREEDIYKYSTINDLPEGFAGELEVELIENTPISKLVRKLKYKLEKNGQKILNISFICGKLNIEATLSADGKFLIVGGSNYRQQDAVNALKELAIYLLNLKENKTLREAAPENIEKTKKKIFAEIIYPEKMQEKMWLEYELWLANGGDIKFVDDPKGRNPFKANYFLEIANKLYLPLFENKNQETTGANVYYIRWIKPYYRVINQYNPEARCRQQAIDNYVAYTLRELGDNDSAEAIDNYLEEIKNGKKYDENLFYNKEKNTYFFAPKKGYIIKDEQGKITERLLLATTFVSGFFKDYKLTGN